MALLKVQSGIMKLFTQEPQNTHTQNVVGIFVASVFLHKPWNWAVSPNATTDHAQQNNCNTQRDLNMHVEAVINGGNHHRENPQKGKKENNFTCLFVALSPTIFRKHRDGIINACSKAKHMIHMSIVSFWYFFSWFFPPSIPAEWERRRANNSLLTDNGDIILTISTLQREPTRAIIVPAREGRISRNVS